VGKGPDAFRTISEVADDLDVPKHVLRFWEKKFTHVKPMKRGGGRRYYRPEDVDLLRGIRALLHDEGYTIRGLQRVFRQHGINYIKNYAHVVEASNSAMRGANKRVPDIAGEAAGHAREAAMQRAKAPSTGMKRETTAGKAAKSAAAASPSFAQAEGPQSALSARQRQTLEQALSELESCRELLASAASS